MYLGSMEFSMAAAPSNFSVYIRCCIFYINSNVIRMQFNSTTKQTKFVSQQNNSVRTLRNNRKRVIIRNNVSHIFSFKLQIMRI